MNYSDYRKSTQKQMKATEAYLKRRFGAVSPEWEMSLRLLADNLDLYEECVDKIKEVGVFPDGRKNQLLPVLRDIQATISKLVQHIGISPYAAAKIKATEEDDSNLLANLMGED